MIAFICRGMWKAKMIVALAGAAILIVAVSYSRAAAPKKPSAEPREAAKPSAAHADSSKPTDAEKDARLTRANYEQVHYGMTVEEVTAILGPPGGSSTNVGTVNGRPYNHKGMMWRKSDYSVTIRIKFNDGKVSSKEWSKLSPHAQKEIDDLLKRPELK